MSRLHLFEAVGIEIEHMLVDRDHLAVLPAADRVLAAIAGEVVSEVAVGDLAWSNELVLHVLELKTNGPAGLLEVPTWERLRGAFETAVAQAGEVLAPLGGRLLGTAMHPWMDPWSETVLWPHEHSPIYQAYDRLFDCRGHGWSNLQSLHLNLPFADDTEFGRLHAGIRLLLPLLPALAASSPLVEGHPTGWLDNRMEHYRRNSRRIPSVTAAVVPEPVWSEEQYRREVFAPMYRDVAPFDPEGILQDEFLNSRGAIARFGRGSIEIRVIDVQECPRADLALAVAVVGVLRLLAEEAWSPLSAQQERPTEPLAELLTRTAREGERAVIDDRGYLALFGLTGSSAVSAGALWHHLVDELARRGALPEGPWGGILEGILRHGPLARRILAATGPAPRRDILRRVYGELADCLAHGRLFGV
jgi:gamma-glutamyl:cysteine ligase YbdK (ATP-grasp superfamily)